MSYSRTFTKNIQVHYSGTTSYGPSQTGGTVSYSGVVNEVVEIEVHVDTDAFDASIDHCSNHVNALTAGIAATEAAEVVSIKENSLKIGNTIIDGFFKNIRFELSAQIMELSKRIDAQLLDIKSKADRLIALKHQMQTDYNRTTTRYSKLFGDLDQELKNRIVELDQPVFDVAYSVDKSEARMFDTDFLSVSSIISRESALLEAQISSAVTRSHARKALVEMGSFLSGKQAAEDTISHSTIAISEENRYYLPVCYVQTITGYNTEETNLYTDSCVKEIIANHIDCCKTEWRQFDPDEMQTIKRYFVNYLSEQYPTDENHQRRVKKMISKLFNMVNGE